MASWIRFLNKIRKMKKTQFKYKVKLESFKIENSERTSFLTKLNEIPYLLYEVEQLSDKNKIVINKPGGKRDSYGRLQHNDFMVFIYNPSEESLWLISHDEIKNDLIEKYQNHKEKALLVIKSLYAVCNGEEPDNVINKLHPSSTVGLPIDTILKVYKWIWGQEDCNYPNQKGRWLSMDAILNEFKLTKEDVEK